MARIVLALLVVINLTLVCWGHDEDGHHTGVHLTFLGEPEHDMTLVVAVPYAVNDEIHNAGSEQTPSRGGACPAPTTTVALTENSLPDDHAVSTLGVALIALVAALGRASGFRWSNAWATLRSQTTVRPPIPPPRLSPA